MPMHDGMTATWAHLFAALSKKNLRAREYDTQQLKKLTVRRVAALSTLWGGRSRLGESLNPETTPQDRLPNITVPSRASRLRSGLAVDRRPGTVASGATTGTEKMRT